MARGSSLSDSKVIEKINQNFIPVEINLSNQGFPKDVPALKAWENAYEQDWRYKFGFATSVAMAPEGNFPLGTSGSGHIWEYKTSINYEAGRYLKFLDECVDRFQRVRALQTDAKMSPQTRAAKLVELQGEILRSIQEANKSTKPAGWNDADAAKLAK